ncbi:SDR family oxidoreductase [Nonomuraea dietziae]|uniref:SDR family oxidoreductase n=1 Tax=Nonomuraea dietziae TaxID=65515 RepID=UPI00343052E8
MALRSSPSPPKRGRPEPVRRSAGPAGRRADGAASGCGHRPLLRCAGALQDTSARTRTARRRDGEIERAGGAAFAVGAELGVDDDVENLFAGVEAGLAGRPLDILVNNAAAAPAGPLGATTREEFDHLFAVNVRAPYFIIQRALPLLRDGGRIVTISSVATRMANPAQTSFAMTKGAVETMSMTLANQLGVRGITVNAVAPGATRTAVVPVFLST